MVDFLDAILPIAGLIVFALLTVPVLRRARITKHPTGFSLAWFAIIFGTVFAAVGNLTSKYYASGSADPSNITLAQPPLSSLSTAFMIDAMSIYMAIIICAVSAVVF